MWEDVPCGGSKFKEIASLFCDLLNDLMVAEMKIHWPQHHFELILTADQSPTLRMDKASANEAMHHSGGAYSETQQIYGDPLRRAIMEGKRSVVSVGLGLGYNEILIACEALKEKISPGDFFLLSFESEMILKDHFLTWLRSPEQDFVYDQIFEFFQASMALKGSPVLVKQTVKDWLLKTHVLGNWQLREALLPGFETMKKYEVIFYDAFSAKTTPELWDEEFLVEFLRQVSAPQALVSSYACRGSLTRALKKTGFKMIPQKGFHGKRNSTFAIKDIR